MRRPVEVGYFLELLALGGETLLSQFSKRQTNPLKEASKLPLAQRIYRTAEISGGIMLISLVCGWIGCFLLF
jgi:hypothetical protein